MNNIPVDIELLSNYKKEWGIPAYSHDGDAGFDLRAAIESSIRVRCLSEYVADVLICDDCGTYMLTPPRYNEMIQHIIPTGIKMAIPSGFQLEIRPRSGLAAKYALTVTNAPGTIDQGYRGEICVIVSNLGIRGVTIEPGDRIAQAVLMPVYRAEFNIVEQLDETTRGEGGFGSTGKK